MKVAGWRIFYNKNRQYNSKHHRWEDLPNDGILVLVVYYKNDHKIVLENSPKRKIYDGDTYYFHIPGTELYGNNNDPPEETRERFPGCSIKKGIWEEAEIYYKVKQQAWEAKCP